MILNYYSLYCMNYWHERHFFLLCQSCLFKLVYLWIVSRQLQIKQELICYDFSFETIWKHYASWQKEFSVLCSHSWCWTHVSSSKGLTSVKIGLSNILLYHLPSWISSHERVIQNLRLIQTGLYHSAASHKWSCRNSALTVERNSYSVVYNFRTA